MAARRLGRVILAGIVAMAGLATAGTAFVLLKYHESTKIDRSVPKVVVRDYIDAALVRRDSDREGLYTCARGPLDSISTLRNQLINEEANGVSTQVVIAQSLESDGGRTVDTVIQLNQAVGLHVDRRSQHWLFHLRDENGWRVCSAERIEEPSPTPTQPTTG